MKKLERKKLSKLIRTVEERPKKFLDLKG